MDKNNNANEPNAELKLYVFSQDIFGHNDYLILFTLGHTHIYIYIGPWFVVAPL